ncbi:MAG: response regulator [Pyrinomonadaceae bacterium]|nr:response regulator [Pyrinomonadaceae bacterium]
MNYKILVVDDEPANTRLLERVLRNDYDVVTAGSGFEAMELLAVHDIALIVSDQRMPGMTGIDFLKKAAEMRPHCVRIILTGYTDAGELVDAINSGVVYRYLTKPWASTDLLLTVKRALSHYETIKAQHRLNLTNQRLRDQLTATETAATELCDALLKMRGAKYRGRAARIRDVAFVMGKAMNFDAASLDVLASAAYLHAVADIYVPDELLFRSTPMSDEEAEQAARMREAGLKLLDDVPGYRDVAMIVRYRHENFDGSGTPEGLSGAQIPVASRILAVATAYVSRRDPETAGAGMTHDTAVTALVAAAGKKYDPVVVDVLAKLKSGQRQPAPPVSKDEPVLTV